MEWVLVGCDKFKNGMDELMADKMFAELLPEIEKTAQHDPETLYMGGFSGGAMRSYDYSARFERPWKGIVACGGWLGGPDNWDQDYTKNMAVAMINGNGDKAANSWIERDTDVHRCAGAVRPGDRPRPRLLVTTDSGDGSPQSERTKTGLNHAPFRTVPDPGQSAGNPRGEPFRVAGWRDARRGSR